MRIDILVALSALYGVAALACGDDGAPPEQRTTSPVTFRVEGAGMAPTLEDGTSVEVFDYGNSAPARGDIIVFRSPTSLNRDFIKRIIAGPGDTIQISAGQVMVNGDVLAEPYTTGTTGRTAECALTMPPAGTPESMAACGSSACYFVMGDNRQNSSDSRQGWYVPRENISGWVDLESEPLGR